MRIDLRGMSRTCYRYKSCEFPPSPHTADEVEAAFEVEQNMNRFGKCWVGNQKDGEEEQANAMRSKLRLKFRPISIVAHTVLLHFRIRFSLRNELSI